MKKYLLASVFVLKMLSSVVAGNSISGENIRLVTDRALYLTGENIHFSCALLSVDQEASTIAYIELISPDGEKILGQKRIIQNGICKGALTVPEEIISGHYYLRAYTKVMRNHPVETFSYCLLKIVNPERSEILKYNNPNSTDHPSWLEDKQHSSVFEIEIDTDTIGTREEVHVYLRKKETSPGNISHTVISIVPEKSGQKKELVSKPIQIDRTIQGPFSIESDGLTISGTIQGQDRPQPVNITLLGKERNNFYPVKTDSSGRFSFVFAEKYGKQDLFISFKDRENAAELLIDNDFCSKTITLPSPPFELSAEEMQFLLQVAQNQKLNQYFEKTTLQAKETVPKQIGAAVPGDIREPTAKQIGAAVPGPAEATLVMNQIQDTIPFYGKPDHMVHLSDFIQMNQLKDYLTELPVPVRIRKKGDEDMITITGVQAEMNIFPPLLMVDFAPVYDASSILQMDPEKISRFDVLAAPYIRGEMTYGGILNVISSNNDFAGTKLPEKGLFVNYQLLTDSYGFHNRSTPLPPHIPDVRSTLFWDPSFDFGNSDAGTFHFLSGDMQGNYVIRVTGFTSTGKVLVSEKHITVVQ
jgi:hypothetical protein